MLPYQPNSDALVPPPAWLTLPVEPGLPLPLCDWDSFFPRAVFSFLADFSLDFAELCFGLSEGFGDAFTTSAFFGVDFPILQPRDLERRLTKRCSPDLRPWLPDSSESALRSVQRARPQSRQRFARNGHFLPFISILLW